MHFNVKHKMRDKVEVVTDTGNAADSKGIIDNPSQMEIRVRYQPVTMRDAAFTRVV